MAKGAQDFETKYSHWKITSGEDGFEQFNNRDVWGLELFAFLCVLRGTSLSSPTLLSGSQSYFGKHLVNIKKKIGMEG